MLDKSESMVTVTQEAKESGRPTSRSLEAVSHAGEKEPHFHTASPPLLPPPLERAQELPLEEYLVPHKVFHPHRAPAVVPGRYIEELYQSLLPHRLPGGLVPPLPGVERERGLGSLPAAQHVYRVHPRPARVLRVLVLYEIAGYRYLEPPFPLLRPR